MKKPIRLSFLCLALPLLSGCVIGTVLGTTAEIAGTAVSVGAKVTKTGADVATNAVKKASNTVVGDQDKKAKAGSSE
jgi:hypothetical protein